MSALLGDVLNKPYDIALGHLFSMGRTSIWCVKLALDNASSAGESL